MNNLKLNMKTLKNDTIQLKMINLNYIQLEISLHQIIICKRFNKISVHIITFLSDL